MKYYPLFFDLKGKLCVVIGGGRVAERKARSLIRASACVRLISPRITKGISGLYERGKIGVVRREYREGDLAGAGLVFAATGLDEVNRMVREECIRRAIPLNVADRPELCDFIVPSVVRRKPVTIAISTSGLLPMLSKKLRKEVVERLTADYVAYAKVVGAFRKLLLREVKDGRQRREIMKRLGEAPVSEVAPMTVKELKERFLPNRERPTGSTEARAANSPADAKPVEDPETR